MVKHAKVTTKEARNSSEGVVLRNYVGSSVVRFYNMTTSVTIEMCGKTEYLFLPIY